MFRHHEKIKNNNFEDEINSFLLLGFSGCDETAEQVKHSSLTSPMMVRDQSRFCTTAPSTAPTWNKPRFITPECSLNILFCFLADMLMTHLLTSHNNWSSQRRLCDAFTDCRRNVFDQGDFQKTDPDHQSINCCISSQHKRCFCCEFASVNLMCLTSAMMANYLWNLLSPWWWEPADNH